MSDEAANNLAVKIARLLQTEAQGVDLNSLQTSIEKINERLIQIESKLNNQNSNGFVHPSSFNLQPSKPHPSQEKFEVAEAIAHQIPGHIETEKACIFEPHGKPCDHCSMCNSRGF